MDGRRGSDRATRVSASGTPAARATSRWSAAPGPWWRAVAGIYACVLAASVAAPTARALGLGPARVAPALVALAAVALWRVHRRAGVRLGQVAPSLVASLVPAVLVGRSLTLSAERLHIVLHGALGFALAVAIRRDHRGAAGWWLLGAATIGLGTWDELLQGLLPSRVYGADDVLLNWVSAALGILASGPLVAAAPASGARRRAPLRAALAVSALSLVAMALAEIPTFDPRALAGSWRGTNRCGWIETLCFDDGAVLRWRDDRGHTARGTWKATSNVFHEHVLDMHVLEDTLERPASCGLHTGPPHQGRYADPLVLSGDDLWLGPRRNHHFTRVR